ncbi:hypothetical protein NDU88_004379 [Pleurodeles waltl]|uniref:Uncharacterized protein n=1 Tax=Pleurodeles waltl TaxID=8319 RepID=A0AAV7WXK7_PLEWA|nr:hypothetical protein NDU88_004379 [Pleurodeles waltl]
MAPRSAPPGVPAASGERNPERDPGRLDRRRCSAHGRPRGPSDDGEYHPFKGSLHSEEEERLEENFRVLTLASGRKEEPDLEVESSLWQLEAKTGKNSAERPEEEQTLGHLPGPTGVEKDVGPSTFAVTQSRRR